MNTEARLEIVVRRCAERKEAELYALVLSASGIASAIVRDTDGLALLVAPEDADRARNELAAYDAEKRV